MGPRARAEHARHRLHVDHGGRTTHEENLAANHTKQTTQHRRTRHTHPPRQLAHNQNHLRQPPPTTRRPALGPTTLLLRIRRRSSSAPTASPHSSSRRLPHGRVLCRPLSLLHHAAPTRAISALFLPTPLHNTSLGYHISAQVLVVWLAPLVRSTLLYMGHSAGRVAGAKAYGEACGSAC